MPRVTELWAWVIEDSGPDNEGVPAYQDGGAWLPMIGADAERVQSLRDLAQLIADLRGKPIKLLRASEMEVVETVEPRDA